MHHTMQRTASEHCVGDLTDYSIEHIAFKATPSKMLICVKFNGYSDNHRKTRYTPKQIVGLRFFLLAIHFGQQ
jgi:hypothetical protein